MRDRRQLYVREQGPSDAPTLVLLHSLSTSGWMWHRQSDLLSEYRTIAPDLPGHGESNDVRWTSLPTTARLVADEIERRVGDRRAHVVGLSLGGYVALQLMAAHGGLVDRVVVSGVSVLGLVGRARTEAAAVLAAPLLHSDAAITANARNLHVPPDQIDDYRQTVKQMGSRSYLTAVRDVSAFDVSDGLRFSTHPLLVLAGERERSPILETLAPLARAIPNAEARVVPDGGHAWTVEHPELFSATVRRWLTDGALPDALRPAG